MRLNFKGATPPLSPILTANKVSEIQKANESIRLNDKYQHVRFTKRESEYINYMLSGYTIKDSAEQMGISHRTIEGYLLDIKQKIQDGIGGILNKDQLIQILKGSNIQ
jgi:DNA-binding CsgD family transcriptional regulator